MRVVIITFCRKLEALYGSLLVFQTLRVGFPTAEVFVYDNASIPASRAQIREAAASVGAKFQQGERSVEHWELLSDIINKTEDAVAFVDPDVVFWRSVEGWNFPGALLAGRRLPDFQDPYTQTLTVSRLHTSLLFVPSPVALRSRINQIGDARGGEFAAIAPMQLPTAAGWLRWDTFAAASFALADEAHAFSEEQLDAYDHLFCGSHLDLVVDRISPEWRHRWIDTHANAKDGSLEPLRGLWREQQKYFESLSP